MGQQADGTPEKSVVKGNIDPIDGSLIINPQSAPPVQPAPEEIRFSREALDQRLARERNKAQTETLKSMGFESMEQYAEFKKSYEADQEAKRQAELEKMDELERYKAELDHRDKAIAEAKAATEAAEAKLEAARVEAHLNSIFAKNKITNTSYAHYKFEEKLRSLENGQELDEQAFIDELINDQREAIALGVVDPKAPTTTVPLTTTAPKDGPSPVVPGNGDEKHKSQMTTEEWKAWRQAHGLS